MDAKFDLSLSLIFTKVFHEALEVSYIILKNGSVNQVEQFVGRVSGNVFAYILCIYIHRRERENFEGYDAL